MKRKAWMVGSLLACAIMATVIRASDSEVGVKIEDAAASELRGGACTGYVVLYCSTTPCSGMCYISGGGNYDQNASNLGAVCLKIVDNVFVCGDFFQTISPCATE